MRLSTHVSSPTTRILTDEPPKGWTQGMVLTTVTSVSPTMTALALKYGCAIIRPCLEALAENSPLHPDTSIGSPRKEDLRNGQ